MATKADKNSIEMLRCSARRCSSPLRVHFRLESFSASLQLETDAALLYQLDEASLIGNLKRCGVEIYVASDVLELCSGELLQIFKTLMCCLIVY